MMMFLLNSLLSLFSLRFFNASGVQARYGTFLMPQACKHATASLIKAFSMHPRRLFTALSGLKKIRLRLLTLTILAITAIMPLSQSQACTGPPAGVEGEIAFLDPANVPAYCDGTNWIAMVGGDPALGGGDYVPNAVEFDGTNDYVSIDGTAIADSTQLTFSFWVKQGSASTTYRLINDDGDHTQIFLGDDNTVGIFVRDNSSSQILGCQTDATSIDDTDNWHHFLFSMDSATGDLHIYIDDVDETPGWCSFNSSGLYSPSTNLRFGADHYGNFHDVDLSDVWYDVGSYIDFSIEANRRNFISASGTPVYLGSNGEIATGSPPDIFLSGSTDTWHVNKGNGGTTTEVGALTDATTSPVTERTKIVPSGLIGHWRLDETSGTTAFDSSGNNIHGVYAANASSRTRSGIVNTSMSLGQSSYLNITNPAIDNLAQFSMCFWIRDGGYSGPGSTSNYMEKPNGWRMDTYRTDRNLDFFRNGWPEISTDFTNLQFLFTDWRHYCILFDETVGAGVDSTIFYVNGEFNTSGAPGVDTSNDDSGTTWRIGGAAFHNGVFDDLRLYNRVLTPEEIAEIYAARDGIRYNASYRVPEYFDGNQWVSLTPVWPEPGGNNATSSSSYVDDITALNPIVYYRLNDTNVTMVDDTGTYDGNHNNNPTYGASPSPADPSGASIYFNGASNEYSRAVDDPLFDTTQGTVIAWFNIDDASGGLEAVFAKDGGGDTDGQFYVGVNNGDIDGRVQQDGGSTTFTYDPSATSLGADVQNGTWYMLSMAYGTGGVDFYLNDVFLGTETRLTRTDSDRNFFIGADNSTGSAANFFTGFIDEVSWLPTKLDSTAIANLYNARANTSVSSDPSLIAHWKLDETEGTTLVDSITGDTGTPQGSLNIQNDSAQGAIGGSLAFNGVNDDIAISTSWSDLIEFTYAAWIKPDDWGESVLGRIIHKGSDPSDPAGGSFLVCNGAGVGCNSSLRFEMGGTLTNGTWNANNSITLGVWQHVAVSFDKSSITNAPTLYVNGVQQTLSNSNSVTGAFPADDNNMWIGSRIGNLRFFNGNIDDVRIYDRILTTTEIQQLYQMGAPVGSSTALPLGCPNPGDFCDDGSFFVGNTPDGGVEMFMTSLSYESSGMFWGSAPNTSNPLTGINDIDNGDGNTNALVTTDSDSVTTGFQTHPAAQYCYDLVAHGADDWYLPAQDELAMLYNGGNGLGDIKIDGTGYWSSSERSGVNTQAKSRRFTNTFNSNSSKSNTFVSRCVRQGPAPRCANPYGVEGAMLYNTDHDVVQYCDGARWVAIGKRN